ncbi:hypothetical protein FN846DRAFT_911607 [Sphaerosporella brunnea]|uniref:Uncharacterized protein n=1 Tax=Sphaerosporella brunnea TaxID=1250544 RepID=A0A5J5EIR9_9PEZI|nr:hypothetical protein FN846DRAFT_911607 [Sphaerosporella brunnea]
MAYHGFKVDRSPLGFSPGKIWQWHWEQCVIRRLRAAAEGNPEDKYYDNEPPVETIATVTHPMADLDITGATPGNAGVSVVAINGVTMDNPLMTETHNEDIEMAAPPPPTAPAPHSAASSRPPSPAEDASLAFPNTVYTMPMLDDQCKGDLRLELGNARYVC